MVPVVASEPVCPELELPIVPELLPEVPDWSLCGMVEPALEPVVPVLLWSFPAVAPVLLDCDDGVL